MVMPRTATAKSSTGPNSSMEMPVSGGMEKVSGKSSAKPMVAERPGIAPMNRPSNVPRKIIDALNGDRTLSSPISM